jgi:hypothetical protein
MKKLLIPILSTGCLLGSALSLQAQPITEFINFGLVGEYDPDNKIALDGSDHTLASNTLNPGLFQSIYGTISGNTISRADFKSAVTQAYNSGNGGVIDFETVSYSGGTYQHPTAGTINRTGGNLLQAGGAGGITIQRGPNWWYEGSTVTPYRGTTTGAFDGTGPSGPDRLNYSEVFFFTQTANAQGGFALGQTTSYDLVFDTADKIGIVGFSVINYDNFQSWQSGGYAGYPNIHAIATFTNGVDSLTQMSVGLTQQVASGNDYFFGFEGPAGYFLSDLDVYAIGREGRVFITVDDLGYVQVPEPATYAAILGLLVLGCVAWRRRRKA